MSAAKKMLGYFLLVLYIIGVLSMSEVTRRIEDDFNRPFVIRYVNSSMFVLIFVLPGLWKCQRRQRPSPNIENYETVEDQNLEEEVARASIDRRTSLPRRVTVDDSRFFGRLVSESDTKILTGTFRSFISYAFVCTWLVTGAGMMWYVSMNSTKISTNLTLTRMRAPFVFILSVIFLGERVTTWKSLAVMLAFSGAVFIAAAIQTQSDDDDSDTWWGALLALLSGWSWGVKDIVYRFQCDKNFYKQKLVGTFLHESWEGIFTVLCFPWAFWAQQPMLHMTKEVWGWIILNGGILIMTNLAYDFAISFIPPIQMAVGGLLAIPLSFLMDVFFHGYAINYLVVIGSCLVIGGYVMLKVIPSPKWMNDFDVYLAECCCKPLFGDRFCYDADDDDNDAGVVKTRAHSQLEMGSELGAPLDTQSPLSIPKQGTYESPQPSKAGETTSLKE